MNKIPQTKKGIKRLWNALLYSMSGLRYAISHETAFQQEVFVYGVLLVLLFFLPLSPAFKCLLFLGNTIVLIVELLNSAIESTVDMLSPDYNRLAKQAKDLGSAAVLISLLLAVTLWAYAIIRLVAS